MPYIGKSPHFGVRNRFIYTATAGNTSKSGADDNGATLTFTDGAYVDVYLNGSLLKPDTDYVTTTANTIGSIAAMSLNDILEVVVYDVFSVSDTVSATSGGTFSAGVNIDGGVVVNESSADVDFRVESNGQTHKLFVNGGEDVVCFGFETPETIGGIESGVQIEGTDYAGGSLSIWRNANDDAGGYLNLGKSRGTAVNSDTIIQDNDDCGIINFFGADGGDRAHPVASIRGAVDGTPGSNDMPGRLEFWTTVDGGTTMAEKMRIDNAGKVGIETSDPQRSLSIGTHGSSSTAEIAFGTTTTGYSSLLFGDSTSGAALYSGYLQYQHNGDYMILASSGLERMRILSGGDIVVGRTSNDLTAAGVSIEAAGTGGFVRSNGPCLILSRLTNDGEIIRLDQGGTTEGTISVSGSTISYNAFSGSHWSRLADNSKPTILRGTVIETIDEMCDWYQAEYTSQVEEKYEDGDDIPNGKKVGDIKQNKIVNKDYIALPEGKKVGDTITHTVDGVDYTAKILQEADYKHPKCKVSETAECTNVYGVFLDWDNDDDSVNDMYVNAVGTNLVRIHKDQTVSKGDLLTSNGDGTAKKQSDDIIRSKTIGKVLSNKKQETYSDGSYVVPCALYCG